MKRTLNDLQLHSCIERKTYILRRNARSKKEQNGAFRAEKCLMKNSLCRIKSRHYRKNNELKYMAVENIHTEGKRLKKK